MRMLLFCLPLIVDGIGGASGAKDRDEHQHGGIRHVQVSTYASRAHSTAAEQSSRQQTTQLLSFRLRVLLFSCFSREPTISFAVVVVRCCSSHEPTGSKQSRGTAATRSSSVRHTDAAKRLQCFQRAHKKMKTTTLSPQLWQVSVHMHSANSQ